jgi:hypothetical protein
VSHADAEEASMPVAFVHEFPIGDRSTENYDFLMEKLAGQEIDGLLVHAAGFDDDAGVWRQVDIWETREQGEKFMEQVMGSITPESLPRPEFAEVEPSRQATYELHGFRKH